MSFPKYPAYKDSGVEWLGEVPEHWNVAPVGRHYQIRNGFPFAAERFSPEGTPEHRLVRIRDILGNDSPIYTDEVCPPQCAVDNGDVLIGMDGDFNISYWMDGRAKLNQRVCAVRGKNSAWDRFFFYGISAPLKLINDLTFATTVKHLASSQILKARFPVPPANEVEQIARFLDHETARIDALIEEQQRLIELLKEKRQAVISHAVTKGLDPTVPMKDSGVEWLGEVPAHWVVVRLGAVYSEAVEKGVAELPVLRVSIHHGVSDKEITEDESDRKITRIEDREKYKRVRPGDLVYNMMRAWQGGFGAVMVDGLVSPAYVVARPVIGEDFSRYVEQLLRTECAVEEMRKNSYGITDFRLRLYWDQFKNIRIVIPPELERQQIMARLDALAAETKSLQNEADHLVTVLQERRTALISAAVTGKIDVRNWQPPTKKYAGVDTQNRTEPEVA